MLFVCFWSFGMFDLVFVSLTSFGLDSVIVVNFKFLVSTPIVPPTFFLLNIFPYFRQ